MLTTEALVSEIPEEKKEPWRRPRRRRLWAACTKHPLERGASSSHPSRKQDERLSHQREPFLFVILSENAPRPAHLTARTHLTAPCHPEERSDVGPAVFTQRSAASPPHRPHPHHRPLVIQRSAATWDLLFTQRSAVSPPHRSPPHPRPLLSKRSAATWDLLFTQRSAASHLTDRPHLTAPSHPEERSDVGPAVHSTLRRQPTSPLTPTSPPLVIQEERSDVGPAVHSRSAASPLPGADNQEFANVRRNRISPSAQWVMISSVAESPSRSP